MCPLSEVRIAFPRARARRRLFDDITANPAKSTWSAALPPATRLIPRNASPMSRRLADARRTAATLLADGQVEGQALADLAVELRSPAGAATFVGAVGVTADEELVKAFTPMLTLADSVSVTVAELIAAASMAVEDPDTAWRASMRFVFRRRCGRKVST